MPRGRRRSSVSVRSSPPAPQDQPYDAMMDSGLPSPEVQQEEDRKQAELDQQFFAPSSPVHEPAGERSVSPTTGPHHHHHHSRPSASRPSSGSGAKAVVAASSAAAPAGGGGGGGSTAAKDHPRYRPHRRASETSLNSTQGFIDHRAQMGVTQKKSGLAQSAAAASAAARPSGISSPSSSRHSSRADLTAASLLANDQENVDLGGVFDHRRSDHHHRPHSSRSRSSSRAASLTGSEPREQDAQHDVCYPLPSPTTEQGAAAGNSHPPSPRAHHYKNDPASSRSGAAGDNSGKGHGSASHAGGNGSDNTDVPLPSYNALPFDFSVLEDFAAKERESLGLISSPRSATAPTVSFSPDRPTDLHQRSRRFGDDDASGVKTGRMGRARKLSESVATPGSRGGRYQRKLALFEGSGADKGAAAAAAAAGGGAGSGSGSGANPSTSPVAATSSATQRTPLMSTMDKTDYFGTMNRQRPGAQRGASSHRGGGGGGAGSTAEEKSSYRFSFYSNALPTTVHTKFLSELPNEDQSFQELFMGPKPSQHPAHSAFLADPIIPSSAQASKGTSISNGITPGERMRPSHALMRPNEDFESNTWWLDILCPTDHEMKVLSKAFGIHPLTTEDIQMEESREKIELFRNYYFVCFRSFDQDPYSPTYLEPLNMYIVVFREGTLSFHFRGAPHPSNVRRRIKQLKDFINVSSDWISYAIIDDITDAFGPLIQSIEYEVDSIDELVLILKDAEQSDMLRRIGTCRKKVMGLLRLIGQKADVVKGLAKRCNENWSVAPKSDIGLYLSDIQDHLVTMTQNLNHYEKILSRSHSNYLAQISIEMTDANNAINEVLSKLTALGTVLVPMNLITGLWGMNVRVPGQDVDNLHWFLSIVAILVAIAVVGGFATWKAIR